MPRKRSKSEERERKKAYRQNRTAEKIVLDQEKDRIKKKEAWSRKTEEDKDAENNAKRERMKRLRNETSKEKVDTRTKPRDEQEENRERIRKLRSDQSEEDRKIERDKAKERMVVARAKQTFEEKEDENEKAKERMRDLREKQTMEEREEENEKARVRMEMVRADKGTEACAYERIVKRQEIRNLRKGLSGKEHLEGNLNAKKGMQLLNSVGRLRKFESRDAGMKSSRKRDELFEWKKFMQTSEKHREILSEKQPDIVSRINENARQAKEKEQQEIENYKEGEWLYNGESGEYYWTGDTEPEYDNTYDNPSPPTKEELEIVRQAEEREMAELIKQRKQEMVEKREKKKEERKAAMEKPVAPLPERELCKYERIREDIIREREEAMAHCKFFENLEKTKKEIGLYTKANK